MTDMDRFGSSFLGCTVTGGALQGYRLRHQSCSRTCFTLNLSSKFLLSMPRIRLSSTESISGLGTSKSPLPMFSKSRKMVLPSNG